jgi:transcriptional regulator NrdR family protein
MRCQACGGRTAVIDSRLRPYGVLRRRRCRACGARVTTIEVVRAEMTAQFETEAERLVRARALVAELVALLEMESVLMEG